MYCVSIILKRLQTAWRFKVTSFDNVDMQIFDNWVYTRYLGGTIQTQNIFKIYPFNKIYQNQNSMDIGRFDSQSVVNWWNFVKEVFWCGVSIQMS